LLLLELLLLLKLLLLLELLLLLLLLLLSLPERSIHAGHRLLRLHLLRLLMLERGQPSKTFITSSYLLFLISYLLLLFIYLFIYSFVD
jgi:hypothetical protein